ncbi:hydrophobic surface binding protein A domain-containing protein [Pochonia chlamydosporia 170]|uniref:Hydrophobic surface binding protein A domain-containing protein n=1 Tax=Pochonia chlamydosporia 170 TaxID=1380566 RepID=A0A179F4I1_METCM|nr:hydrophobic surface binding protein A domain-containing protein [Pochonia chlamydosporia 170]OAQ60337.1 hydrophobic surface binding protein A domain-containing protein [Pochonia chlamydosporia 170]
MKLSVSATTLLCAISGADAYRSNRFLDARDAKAITDVFAAVQSNIDSLDQAVLAWTCNPGPVLKASYTLISTIKTGVNTVSASANLTLSESLSLLTPVQNLKTHAQTLVNDLKAKKPQIQTDFECDVVRQTISDMSTNSKGLVDATISKVPAAAQDIAKKQAQGILDVLNDAQTSFNTTNCVNA